MSPLVAGREPAKSATDASSREAPFSSWLGRLFTHRFSRRAFFPIRSIPMAQSARPDWRRLFFLAATSGSSLSFA